MVVQNAVLTPVTPEAVARISMSKDVEKVPEVEGVESETSIEQAEGHDAGHILPQWSKFWIYSAVVLSMLYSLLGGWVSLSLSPFYFILAEEYQRSISAISWLTSVLVLVLGFGNFITVPVAVCYGRRHAYFWSSVVTLGSCFWAAKAATYDSLLGARILMGLGTAGIETLTPMTVVDVLPRERRGTWNSVYFNMLFGGGSAGAIVSGIIAGSSLEWRWFFWITSILAGLLCIGIFFLMPETIPHSFMGNVSETNSRRPTKAAFSLKPAQVDSDMTFLKALARPWYVLLSPVTIYSSFMFGLFACMFLVAQVAQAQIFAVNYGFDVTQTSLTNFAFLIGQMIGVVFSGYLADALLARALKRHGRWEPEMRLPALIPTGAIIILGMVLAGVAIERKFSWGVVVVAYGLLSCGCVSTVSVSVTYAIDSHKAYAGEFMLMATIIKNCISFGFAYVSNDWFMAQGFLTPFLILTGIALFLLFVPSVAMYVWGARMRAWVKERNFLPSGGGLLSEE